MQAEWEQGWVGVGMGWEWDGTLGTAFTGWCGIKGAVGAGVGPPDHPRCSDGRTPDQVTKGVLTET